MTNLSSIKASCQNKFNEVYTNVQAKFEAAKDRISRLDSKEKAAIGAVCAIAVSALAYYLYPSAGASFAASKENAPEIANSTSNATLSLLVNETKV